MKTRATRAVLLGVWLAVLAFALLPVLGVGRYSVQWPGTWCFISTGPAGNETDAAREPGSVAFASAFACLGLLSLIVTFACNLATIKALVSRCRAKAAASQSSAQWGRITTETAIQLMGIMCVLSVCWSPLLVSSCEGGAFVARSGKWKLLKVYGTPSAEQAAAPAASGCSLQPRFQPLVELARASLPGPSKRTLKVWTTWAQRSIGASQGQCSLTFAPAL
ncbi:Prostaglandin E2 receptor EP3 subtype [Lemmus lemmus]